MTDDYTFKDIFVNFLMLETNLIVSYLLRYKQSPTLAKQEMKHGFISMESAQHYNFRTKILIYLIFYSNSLIFSQSLIYNYKCSVKLVTYVSFFNLF